MKRPNACGLARLLAGALALAGGGCRRDSGDAVLLVTVTASGSPVAVAALEVALIGPAGTSPSQRYTRNDQQSIEFPTTLTAVVPARATGDLTIDVHALDMTGATVATGQSGVVALRAGERKAVTVSLDCGGSPCIVDGGTGGVADGGLTGGPRCGNGRVDPDETCDTAIPRGDPGACPPADCSDGVACTRDMPSGKDCTATCTHDEIVDISAGDGCCPKNTTSAQDPDCSARCGNGTVDPGETCDTLIAAGSPGACPSPSDCLNGDACANNLLVSAGTCSAICMRYPVTIRSATIRDNCCPPGATHGADVDCPILCGNGVVESGESCDPGIAPPLKGSCPAGCDDGDPCTADFVAGAGCQADCIHLQITAPLSGDGCCPGAPNAKPPHSVDSDCPAACGNGVLEPGEACDKTAVGVNACPTSCPAPSSPCLRVSLVGSADDCSARCETTTVTACSAQADKCCPAGCTNATDPDCSAACGDGVLSTTQGEKCDTAVPPGRAGACPTTCSTNKPCTEARLMSAGTCAATCVILSITEPRAGDGCCPFGADFTVDADCAPVCGNGVVERPAESCDRQMPGSCPATCQPVGACTKVEQQGVEADCSATCVATPIVDCVANDGCCAPGCSAVNDPDCPAICGDGVVESVADFFERCDRAITAGAPGACQRSCDDGDACTVDIAYGSVEGCTRSCTHRPIVACLTGDGCCPEGCTAATDGDCNPVCGDGKLGAGETCDPPATCPTTCPDDGDPCTHERLGGDAAHCDAACHHDPVTACSGSTADACCPTGCTSATDSDC